MRSMQLSTTHALRLAVRVSQHRASVVLGVDGERDKGFGSVGAGDPYPARCPQWRQPHATHSPPADRSLPQRVLDSVAFSLHRPSVRLGTSAANEEYRLQTVALASLTRRTATCWAKGAHRSASTRRSFMQRRVMRLSPSCQLARRLDALGKFFIGANLNRG